MNMFSHIVDNRDLPALEASLLALPEDPGRKQPELDALLLAIAAQPRHHRAKFAHLEEMAAIALDAGADIHAQNAFGSPLTLAAAAGNTALIELLIARGARWEKSKWAGRPPMHHAVLSDDEKLLRCLIKCHAPVNALDENGRNALFEAMEDDRSRFQLPLVKAGADPKMLAEGSSLWHSLAWQSSNQRNKELQATMDRLLRWGVDPHLPNAKGRTARDEALKYARHAFVSIFDETLAQWEARKIQAATKKAAHPSRRRPGL